MDVALFLVAGVAVVVLVAGFARKLGTSAPLLLTLVGAAIGYLPGFPLLEVDREIVLLGLLPPLLYAAAIRTSLIDLRVNLRGIALLSVGLVIFTAVGVGLLVWWLLGIPLPLALAFGGVVAPPDAVAATAVAKRIGLPRSMVNLLEGESLFNDATALVIVRVGLVALAGTVTAWEVGLEFLWAAGGGIAIGILAALIIRKIRSRVRDSVVDTALSFLCPWVAYLPAEEVHASGVLAVVTAGVLLGHQAAVFQTAQSRLSERINWTTIQFVLENGVFLLIGLQAHGIIERVAADQPSLSHLLLVSTAVLVAVILLRPLYILGTLPLWKSRNVSMGWTLRAAGVVSWAGMRGVVTLAAVFILPEDAPSRDLLLLLALVVTAGTLLLQGYTLPTVARAFDIRAEDPREEALQRATVLERTIGAGQRRLDELATPDTPEAVVTALRAAGERRSHAAWERLGSDTGLVSPTAAYTQLRTEMITAEREKLLKIRDKGGVSSEVLDEVMGEIDLEESILTTLTHQRAPVSQDALRTPERQRGQCEELDQASTCATPITPEGCEECLAEGAAWVNLRICLTCGHVGCCDSTPGQHATGHFHQTGHPVMRSFEPGEEWRWCYVHALAG